LSNPVALFKDLVAVSAGFAHKLETVSQGCRLLQLANFSDEGLLLPDSAVLYVPLHEVPARHQLRAGDVLLAAKGARLLAACVEPAWLPAAAATTLLVLRLQTANCLPAFLTLWLNQPAMRQQLRSRLSATSVPTLNKRDLLEVPLPSRLPTLTDQQRLLRLHKLRLEEKELALRLLQVREAEFQGQFAACVEPLQPAFTSFPS
jgi:hypothetical protein